MVSVLKEENKKIKKYVHLNAQVGLALQLTEKADKKGKITKNKQTSKQANKQTIVQKK